MLTTLEEHLGYLSDDRRIEQFRRALEQAISPGDIVADIGCGFGILGLICLQAGASRVWGIDKTEAIEIARETMFRAGLDAQFNGVRESSFHAKLPEKVDAIVCDHVGYFGIDYGILEIMGDARRRLLKPGGLIVPSQVSLFIAGVSSPICRAKAEAWTAAEVPNEYRWLREYGVNFKHRYDFSPSEILSEPVKMGSIDLTQDSDELIFFQNSLCILKDCELDGLAGWFECTLAEGIWMTNSPLAADRIDRHQVFLPFDVPMKVRKEDSIEVSLAIRHRDGLISWSVQNRSNGLRQKQSTWRSKILSASDLDKKAIKPRNLNDVGRASMAILNSVDGQLTSGEIEEAVATQHPDLFPSREEIARFIRNELARSTE